MDKPAYTISGELHTGSTYVTYRARRESDGRHLVLKVLRAPYPSAQALNRLRYEFTLLQQVRHANIINVLALEPVGNSLALVFDEVAGVPLSEFINGRPVDLAVFFTIALPLVEAVLGLHRQRIIHKNLSPANSIINPATQQLTLCGFSLAVELAREGQQANAREALDVNLAYISPEQTGRLNRTIDQRTDLYALGCLFYELLTGYPPFTTEDPMELIHAHLALPPKHLGLLRPNLPTVLVAIVHRLLAKNPEDRYQSAGGLLFDLEYCQKTDGATLANTAFSIGQHDVSDRFQIPGKLYGRTAELTRLQTAFRRAQAGQTGIVLVDGYSGVGKSGLIRELQQTVKQTSGFFISGKFDQFKRDVPLSALLAAFRELIRQVLTGTDTQITHWRQDVLNAVGGSGQVLIEVVPDLALLIGPQPAVPALAPTEATNRFTQLIDRFVNVFIGAEHPLCIFLDDLQWIDSATRQWLESRLTGQQQGHFLFIGAYRDNEVTASHPFMLMLDRLEQRKIPIDRLHLQPLDTRILGQLLADTLATTPDQCTDLTEVIYQKTGGNPFFSRQCLLSLYEDGAIYFKADKQAWTYDLNRVQQAQISDNVVDLMTQLIQRLPASVQNVLKVAACFGSQFDGTTLSLISQQPAGETAVQLNTALQQGLIVPVESWQSQFPQDDEATSFMFLHDRVQQAALSLLPTAQKQTTRLQIGRLLLGNSPDVAHDDHLYDIADHLNVSSHLIDDAAEKQKLVEVNLAASIRAKNSSAYEQALHYSKQAMDLVPATAWQQPSALTRELLLQRAESEHLCGNNQPAEAYFDQALTQTTTTLEKAGAYQRKIHYYINLGKFAQAYQTGREAVRPLGVDLPAAFVPPLLIKDLITYRLLVGRHHIADLIDRKEMTDERLKMAILLMATFVRAAYQIRPELCVAVCTRMVIICLRHGNTDGVSTGFLALGPIFLGAILKQKQTGFDIGQLALALVDKFNSLAYKAETHFVVGYFAVPWRRPAAEMERYWQIAYETGLETGDLFHASCACCGTIQSYFMRGMNFGAVLAAADRYLAFLHRIRNREAILTIQGVQQTIQNLQGHTNSPTDYSDGTFDEAVYVQALTSFGSRHFAHYYYINKMQTLYLWGDYAKAYTFSRQSDQYLSDSPGMLHTAEHHFYKALIICALFPESTGLQRLKWERTLQKIKSDFETYSAGAPSNFSHKSHLIGAEICRLYHDRTGAERLYYAAIDSARQHEYGNILALASERLVSFHALAGRHRVAGLHLSDALYEYRKLGATAYADALQQRYPTLFDPGAVATGETNTAGAATLAKLGAGSLDLATVLKSSEAISRQIRLPDLLAALMKIIIENAGGQRLIFLIQQGADLVVQAECLASVDQVDMLADVPLKAFDRIAQSVVSYVARTREPVILDDAAVSGNFTSDSYIQAAKPRSVLCAPMVQQGKLIGVIYLENNLTNAAFTPDRIDLLMLLSGQLAISIENALLYKNLEEKVNERTAELHQSLDNLRTTQTQLIQKEKMASLGELTAGIAHEIQNPLNFVNNFSDVSVELIEELREEDARPNRDPVLIGELLDDLAQNLQKITHHGGRAAAIVKGMLEHSRTSTGERQLTDLNSLCQDYLRLAYHGQTAKDHRFHCTLVTDFDASLPPVNVIAQEIGQVLLNLANNAFYAVYERQQTDPPAYQPTVTVRTRRENGHINIEVEDNGTGIAAAVKQKIFQPFFTTRPTGEGTGLGLSLSYDIITKGHGGLLTVSSREAEGTTMTVVLPLEV